MEEKELFSDHENRLQKLEESVEKDIGKILSLLSDINQRLVGNLTNDSPGLIFEVKTLRKELEYTKSKIVSVETTLKTTNEKLENLNKYRFIVYGGVIVVGWLLSNLYRVWSFFKDVAP